MSKRLWREAEASAAVGDHARAAAIYGELAQRAARHRDGPEARRAALLAADALRRDDRPGAAAKMLALARQHGEVGPMALLNLGAVLMDAGQIAAARDLVEQAAREAALGGDAALAVLCRDTLAGALLASGDVAGARREVEQMNLTVARTGLAGAEVAQQFRAAQIDRLDGLLARAEAGWRALAQRLAPWAQADGPRGACLAEIGELAELRTALSGGASGALSAVALRDGEQVFAEAGAAWARAGRRIGAMRAEAWQLRLRARSGMAVLPGAVERALTYARARGLPLLEADLLSCLARITGDPAPVQQAIPLLGEAPLARGRARLLAAELGAAPDAAGFALLFDELRGDAAWTARAMLLSPDPAVQAEGRARAERMLAG